MFITFEGGEGCGKSTQTRTLQKRLTKLALGSVLIREPGGTPLGERIRHLLKKSTEIRMSAMTELILFNASRSQLVNDVIFPALKADSIVICDRFTDSTLAYQSYGRGLDWLVVQEMNHLASQNLKPELTFLLDIAPEIGLTRKGSGVNDRFEKEDMEFHRRVRSGFLTMAALEPARWIVIDSTLSRDQIAALIWKEVSRRLKIS